MYTRNEKVVQKVEELLDAARNPDIRQIVIRGELTNSPLIRLSRGQFLRGEDEHASLSFVIDQDGLQLSSDILTLSAIGLSLKSGGSAHEIEINGGVRTNAACIAPVELLGKIESLRISGVSVAGGVGQEKS